MRAPTQRQAEIHAAYEEHGTFAAAARALGVTAPAVAQAVTAYRERTGLPRRAAGLTTRLEEAEHRIAELEGQVELVERLAPLVARLEQLVAQLDGWSPVRWQPDHRRLADGGRRVKDQRA